MFDERIAKIATEQLRQKGIEITAGLSQQEVDHIESLLKSPIPTDLKIFLTEGVPVDNNGESHFPNWHNNPEKIIADARDYIKYIFSQDIKEDLYWHGSFGPKPETSKEAESQAIGVIESWPPLIPIYGHRFMPSTPSTPGNPVLSVWQPDDTIYYGYNLADYLQKEFGIKLPVETLTTAHKIPYWSDVFDLN